MGKKKNKKFGMMDDRIYYPMNMLQEQQYSGTNQDTHYSGFAH